ncbi:hypothetical protein HID58_073184 [Brassica napus]|uniref:Replication factor-A protein 1 N-terminal domain-containing protein n=3 Tax=Brassica TaxID=3705 RepID=A0A0D3D0F5_BRAOL|nr:PREDICTED: uncharacterized protein LOC106298716 [Brassica oleracea var. oleracea]XP_013590314.1 PREDICTED: uncharacterized protein LOC106298716 [Brassica oleracea var. oleracea]XP_013701229.1 uncharacterized protein BNAC06G34540D [Brassica napus]KAG2254123.1 hypothetical protein Bca52824_084259 [Brassica carinata]KAH0875822.1 hypothetical protein HID58_073184 [Brassica napus]CAF2064636.1 unnamed protein product [Brassica napus]
MSTISYSIAHKHIPLGFPFQLKHKPNVFTRERTQNSVTLSNLSFVSSSNRSDIVIQVVDLKPIQSIYVSENDVKTKVKTMFTAPRTHDMIREKIQTLGLIHLLYFTVNDISSKSPTYSMLDLLFFHLSVVAEIRRYGFTFSLLLHVGAGLFILLHVHSRIPITRDALGFWTVKLYREMEVWIPVLPNLCNGSCVLCCHMYFSSQVLF